MTYVTQQMRAALAEHRLRQVCNSNGVRVFRMGTSAMGMDLVFLPDRVGITGAILGQYERGLWSDSKRGLAWFSGALSEAYLCGAFLRPVWVPAVAVEAMRDKLEELREDFQYGPLAECSRAVALKESIVHTGSGGSCDVTRSAEAFVEFWMENVDPEGPEELGWDYAPSDAGWLCAIQQRFAELYRDREARIEAIVAGWEWFRHRHIDGFVTLTARAPAMALAHSDGSWVIYASNDYEQGVANGREQTLDAAKDAACAAVLRQAKEHPELWHCGCVDE